MTTVPFLTIDERSISLTQAITYLRKSGKFSAFLWEILSSDLIEQELQKISAPSADDLILEQAIMDFRQQNELDTLETFQAWLEQAELTHSQFRQQVQTDLQIHRLKVEIVSEKDIQDYFEQQKKYLNQVLLSRIVVHREGEALELKSQINDDGVSFEQLAQEYSITEDSMAHGFIGALRRGDIPEPLGQAIDAAGSTVGEVLGPIELDGLFYLLRVEEFLPIRLDETLYDHLREELFEKWLDDKIQHMNVRLEIGLDDHP
jgi:parvulin-like peptidyl-prolyl isomerase